MPKTYRRRKRLRAARRRGVGSGQKDGDWRVLEHVLRHTAEDQARHITFAMRTQRDRVDLFTLGDVAYDPGDRLHCFNHLAPSGQTLPAEKLRALHKIRLGVSNLRLNLVRTHRR